MTFDMTRFTDAIAGCRRLLVLTGAGIYAESGVPTFRGPEGLWRKHDPVQLATPEAFHADPRLVWEWYAWRRSVIAGCEPNPAHHALVTLEGMVPEFLLATQNVDGLHRRAGSRNLAEIHGNIWNVRRLDGEGPEVEDLRAEIPDGELPLRDEAGNLLRPGVVWYGEMLREEALMRLQQFLAHQPDVVIVIGTSAQVTWVPAILAHARSMGATIININPDRAGLETIAHHHIDRASGDFFGEWLQNLNNE
ncbi:MAG: NAD-dependent protein deacylase [Candidatus Sumerlaeia bacterium]|nr:NAD-dependent protein deacylase [Candidatus Sumerlaeia bacterium]